MSGLREAIDPVLAVSVLLSSIQAQCGKLLAVAVYEAQERQAMEAAPAEKHPARQEVQKVFRLLLISLEAVSEPADPKGPCSLGTRTVPLAR